MTRTLNPGILSRPTPWLTAAILLLIAALVTLFNGPKSALAVSNTDDFSPTTAASASPSCYEWEANKQALGGAAARCEGPSGGEVVYQFDPSGIPANATNIQVSAFWSGWSMNGPGQVEVFITAAGAAFGPSATLNLTTTETLKTTPQQTWGVAWTPSTNAQLKMKWKSGEKVVWDGLQLVVHYTTPDVANLSVNSTGPASALQGQSIAFTVTVGNSGPQTATSVVLNTQLPAGIVHINTTGCVSGGVPNCNLGSIAQGASKTITVNTIAALNATGPKSALFTASSAATDPNINNNDDSHTVTIHARRSYTVCKTWEDNGDAVLEPAKTFLLRIHHSTPGRPPIDLTRTVSEGNTLCAAGFTYNEPLSIEELPLAGFTSAAGYPAWAIQGGASGNGSGPISFPLGFEKVTFTNKAATDIVQQPQQGAKYIEVCKWLEDNGDNLDDSTSFSFAFRADGGAVFETLVLSAVEGGADSCGKVFPANSGVPENSLFTIEELNVLAVFSPPGYPKHNDGNGIEEGYIAEVTIDPASDGFAAAFYNKHEIDPAPAKKSIFVCKTLLDDGDAVDDSGTFGFSFAVLGNPAFTTRSLAAVEGGNPECALLYPADYGVSELSQFEIKETTFPAGWATAPLFPRWLQSNVATISTTAVVSIAPGDPGTALVFLNQHTTAASPTPTATPSPTNTPVPPTSTPVPPSNTPAPPAPPVNTPAPPQDDPQDGPETPGNPGNPDGGNNGGEGPGAPGGPTNPPTQTTTPGNQPPAGEPSTPVAQPSSPSTNDSSAPAGAQPTPIAPATGSGAVTAASRDATAPVVLLGLAGMCAAAAIAMRSRKAGEAAR